MAGTKAGGLKASATNKARYGERFYAEIGKKGGENGTDGGFAKKAPCNCARIEGEHTKPQCAGKLGGERSRRGKVRKIWDVTPPQQLTRG